MANLYDGTPAFTTLPEEKESLLTFRLILQRPGRWDLYGGTRFWVTGHTRQHQALADAATQTRQAGRRHLVARFVNDWQRGDDVQGWDTTRMTPLPLRIGDLLARAGG